MVVLCSDLIIYMIYIIAHLFTSSILSYPLPAKVIPAIPFLLLSEAAIASVRLQVVFGESKDQL